MNCFKKHLQFWITLYDFLIFSLFFMQFLYFYTLKFDFSTLFFGFYCAQFFFRKLLTSFFTLICSNFPQFYHNFLHFSCWNFILNNFNLWRLWIKIKFSKIYWNSIWPWFCLISSHVCEFFHWIESIFDLITIYCNSQL